MYKIKWTRETIAEALKDCTSGNDFRKRYSGAFEAMQRHGWEDLKALLPTHSSNLGDTGQAQVNNVAKRRGIYDELVKDMPRQTGKVKHLADPV